MRVQLMLTCLCDAYFGEVGIATVKILEHAGCEVEFPRSQTCCGQPPFNAGDWKSAKPVAHRTRKVFDPEAPIVVPSASCAAMLRHGYEMLGVGPFPAYELSEFLIDVVNVNSWPPLPQPRRVVFHRSCHGRMIHLGDRQTQLLSLMPGIELLPLEQADQCCGFGGAFAVGHPTVSAGIGLEKLRCLVEAGVDTLVGGDMGCLMHLQGLADKQGIPLSTVHYAQLLAEALP